MENLKRHIAIIGASGNVGRQLLKVMARRNFVPERLSLIASSASAGKNIDFNQTAHTIIALEDFDFENVSLAFFAAGAAIAEQYAPRAAKAGALVIDNSSHFRMAEGVPLCVPEVNARALENIPNNIIANPNCSTMQFVVALAPLHRLNPIESVYVATYQSVSGAGRKAMEDLLADSQKPASARGAHSLMFNVVPKIDVWLENGESKEEWKMRVETAKILDPAIKVSSHCVRVPVLVGHSEAVFVRFTQKIDVRAAADALRKAAGCVLVEENYMTPVECEGRDEVFVSRLRQNPNDDHALQLWITADNLLKGAALNAIQIAEQLIRQAS